jgi:hypothetical protein
VSTVSLNAGFLDGKPLRKGHPLKSTVTYEKMTTQLEIVNRRRIERLRLLKKCEELKNRLEESSRTAGSPMVATSQPLENPSSSEGSSNGSQNSQVSAGPAVNVPVFSAPSDTTAPSTSFGERPQPGTNGKWQLVKRSKNSKKAVNATSDESKAVFLTTGQHWVRNFKDAKQFAMFQQWMQMCRADSRRFAAEYQQALQRKQDNVRGRRHENAYRHASLSSNKWVDVMTIDGRTVAMTQSQADVEYERGQLAPKYYIGQTSGAARSCV